MRKSLIFSVITLLVIGCGFTPRGSISKLPERFTKTHFYETLSTDDTLHRRVKALIVVSGGQLVSRDLANVGVSISEVSTQSRQIALSGDGSVKEYERTYTTTVTVTELSTGIQLGSRVVSTIKNLQLDDRSILAGEEQADITQEVAERSLAQAVIRYLESF